MSEFNLRLVTPGKELVNEPVSEVILPAHDGEAGVLGDHEDFVGLLGTGALKVVRDGNDYWYLVSQGVYEVKDGALTIITQLGEDGTAVTAPELSEVSSLEAELEGKDSQESSYQARKLELERAKARIEVTRRTNSVH